MAKRRKNRPKKKRSLVVRAAVWTIPIAAGAVVGAYAIRWIDDFRKPKVAGAIAGATAQEPIEVEVQEYGPAPNPLAMAAITPVIAAPVAVPYLAAPMVPSAPYPNPYSAPAVEPVPNPLAPPPPPKRRTAAEVRAEREANFDDIVARFEAGEIDFE